MTHTKLGGSMVRCGIIGCCGNGDWVVSEYKSESAGKEHLLNYE